MFQFRLWHNGDLQSGGHNDMHIEIPDLGLNEIFDSYYIADSAQLPSLDDSSKRGLIIDIRAKIEFLLKLLKERLDSLRSILYFPVILDDQYSYALRFILHDTNEFELTFGWTSIEGYGVDLSRPELYSPKNEDFHITNGPAIVLKAEFIQAIDAAIDHMKNVPYKEPSMVARNYPGVTFLYPKEGEEE